MITIRRAVKKDTDRVMQLLSEVNDLHADIRPDLFIHGRQKYTQEQLNGIFEDSNTPVFIAADDNDDAVGYAFCVFKRPAFTTNMTDVTTLYIDDLCVDKNRRGQHIGKELFNYCVDFAGKNGCYAVTLNVWEGNDNAKRFYEKMGMTVRETQMEYASAAPEAVPPSVPLDPVPPLNK